MPISEEPEIPLDITVLRDATVEDVMGYALYEYWTEGRKPAIPEHLRNVVMWNMRIVEDDGTIDDDFPGLFTDVSYIDAVIVMWTSIS